MSTKEEANGLTTGVISCLHCSQSFHSKCIKQTEKFVRLSHNLMICADHWKTIPQKKQQAKLQQQQQQQTHHNQQQQQQTQQQKKKQMVEKQEQKPKAADEAEKKEKDEKVVSVKKQPVEKVCALCHRGNSAENEENTAPLASVSSNGTSTLTSFSNSIEGDFLETPVRLQFADKSIEMAFVHLNCALHSAEVYVKSDGTFCNLTRAIKRGRQLRCTKCKKFGATVGCCMEKCRSNYHLRCALESRGEFLGSAYTLYCAPHAEIKKKEPKKFCLCETEEKEDLTLTLKCAGPNCKDNKFHPKCVKMSGRQAARKAKEGGWFCATCLQPEMVS
jgi:hypothetical protein